MTASQPWSDEVFSATFMWTTRGSLPCGIWANAWSHHVCLWQILLQWTLDRYLNRNRNSLVTKVISVCSGIRMWPGRQMVWHSVMIRFLAVKLSNIHSVHWHAGWVTLLRSVRYSGDARLKAMMMMIKINLVMVFRTLECSNLSYGKQN